jgi:deazaflavin-dependent oxidoreductase (nitroreductase family)
MPGPRMVCFLRRLFWIINKLFMVPMFRVGLGPLVGNPLTGYIMVLKTIGRRSGKLRYTPVNYGIREGNVFCISGFGRSSDWYRNIQANPHIELLMPGGALAGIVEEVADRQERLSALRQILRNAGFAGLFYGAHPSRIPDEVLERRSAGTRIMRIRLVGLGSGPSDAGGWVWAGMLLLTIVLLFLLLK